MREDDNILPAGQLYDVSHLEEYKDVYWMDEDIEPANENNNLTKKEKLDELQLQLQKQIFSD